MSERAERLIAAKTLAEHRAQITRQIDSCGSAQTVLTALADAITDLSAAVAKLIDAQTTRPRKRGKRVRQSAKGSRRRRLARSHEENPRSQK
jgi:hypothetical protein